MRKRPQQQVASASEEATPQTRNNDLYVRSAKRSGFGLVIVFLAAIYAAWDVYYYQYQNLPPPLTAEQAGKRGFSEVEAMKHVKALTDFGPHPVGSDVLDEAIQVLILLSDNSIINSYVHISSLEYDFC